MQDMTSEEYGTTGLQIPAGSISPSTQTGSPLPFSSVQMQLL